MAGKWSAIKRIWPIGESRSVLESRWKQLLRLPLGERGKALKETGARNIRHSYPSLDGSEKILPAIDKLKPDTPPFQLTRYAYRSFDRHWVLLDNRLCDRPRPTLQSAHSEKQVYISCLLTNVLGEGPSVTATALIPDLDHFRGSFGAKHVIPLWRDDVATDANITVGVLEELGKIFGRETTSLDFFSYCYGILASPQYVKKFWDELSIPGPRIPITKDAALFTRTASLGRKLLWLHTYGERFVPDGHKAGRIPQGQARCKVGTPTTPVDYPENYSYNPATQELLVGKGIFENVRPQVWEFSVSGFEVVKSWLGYRMRKRSGKSSSPLDNIRPEVWEFDEELLDLLWVLDHTVDMFPDLAKTLDLVLASELFRGCDFPKPTEAERKGPRGIASETPLLDYAGLEVDENEE